MKTPIDRLKEKLFNKPEYPFVGYHSILARSVGGIQAGLLLSYLLKTYTFIDIDRIIKRDFIGAKNALAMSSYDFNIAFNQLAGNGVFKGAYNELRKETQYFINVDRLLELIKENNTIDEYV